MHQWTAIQIYMAAFAAAGLGGLAVHLRSDKPITVRTIVGEIIYHGLMGAGLGAVAYEWKWRSKPATVIAVAIFYGVGVFTLSEIKAALLRAFNVAGSGTDDTTGE